MKNIALSVKEFQHALLFVCTTTIFIGSLVGLARHFFSEGNMAQALFFGMISSVSWAICISIWAFRRPWTVERIASWTGRPIIHGIWFGKLLTNYGVGDSEESQSIPIAFVIRQTYIGYSLLSYTENQDSKTLVESLSIDQQHQTIHLRYVYEFYIRKPDERKLTTGTAELNLIESGKRLKGHYFTNSPTQGFAELTLVQRSCDGIDTFEAAKKLYEKISKV
ncbi:Cap15 family cyclic dinucleotide receptor domain-containing protein [Marinomonas atlantica]|uniref:Cap15 family cyclic dinucleotide receptor domain-containing protein n=1 Tax=Marinomonas atlantica TaxID=1806668 RepID=UPI000831D246|nr:hypothetical protein [Marinomonas atlantica]